MPTRLTVSLLTITSREGHLSAASQHAKITLPRPRRSKISSSEGPRARCRKIRRRCAIGDRHDDVGRKEGEGSRRAGDQVILTEVEARRVQRWIRDKMPDQMQLPFALWTAQAVRELIHKKLGKTLGLSEPTSGPTGEIIHADMA